VALIRTHASTGTVSVPLMYQRVYQPVPVQASLKKPSITACSAGQHNSAWQNNYQ